MVPLNGRVLGGNGEMARGRSDASLAPLPAFPPRPVPGWSAPPGTWTASPTQYAEPARDTRPVVVLPRQSIGARVASIIGWIVGGGMLIAVASYSSTHILNAAAAPGLLLLSGIVAAVLAFRRGQPAGLWWFFGIFMPVLALPLAVVMRRDQNELDARAIAHGGVKKCPYCGEIIRYEAQVCRYCHRDYPTHVIEVTQ